MSGVLTKTANYNGKLRVFEEVHTDGDYTMIIGQMGEDDNPHYLICNTKYGVVEAGSGTLEDGYKLLEICMGRKAAKNLPKAQTDMFNLN